MLKHLLGPLFLLHVSLASLTSPYNGGNQFGNYYTNPNLINDFLGQINTTVAPACNSIPGVGLPILSIKQVLQSIETSMAFTNQNTSAKIIFFKEKKSTTTFQTVYKLVVQVKSFASNNYIAIEGVYRQVGFPAFEVTTYYVDSNIDNIKGVLAEYGIDPNAFVGCGDVKSIYSQANPGQTGTGNTPLPFNQGNMINSAPTSNQANGSVDPSMIAEIIRLLQKNN